MPKKLLNALRFIAAAIAGYAVYYMWSSIRVDDDWTISVGVGLITVVIAFLLLFFMGKGGGSSD
ncbi:MAG: hypothetical protein PHS02_01985 [Candidatus ainarchaeum sp.]|nr:hypothetical protein [Candidatus ainarchaeum sp.]